MDMKYSGQIHSEGATPSGIEVALHYYSRPVPHPRYDAGAVREAVDALVQLGLMRPDEQAGSGYRFTEKGKTWIELLCETPMPVEVWVDPRVVALQEK
jgi:hypothetical protein